MSEVGLPSMLLDPANSPHFWQKVELSEASPGSSATSGPGANGHCVDRVRKTLRTLPAQPDLLGGP